MKEQLEAIHTSLWWLGVYLFCIMINTCESWPVVGRVISDHLIK